VAEDFSVGERGPRPMSNSGKGGGAWAGGRKYDDLEISRTHRGAYRCFRKLKIGGGEERQSKWETSYKTKEGRVDSGQIIMAKKKIRGPAVTWGKLKALKENRINNSEKSVENPDVLGRKERNAPKPDTSTQTVTTQKWGNRQGKRSTAGLPPRRLPGKVQSGVRKVNRNERFNDAHKEKKKTGPPETMESKSLPTRRFSKKGQKVE